MFGIIKGLIGYPQKPPEESSSQPAEKYFYDVAKESYKPRADESVDGLKLVGDEPTIDAYVNEEQRYLIIGVRGTDPTDLGDLYADVNIILNKLSSTPRYIADKQFVRQLLDKYPGYKIYLAGHSLGGAMATQLKRDFPELANAVEYNPAVQPGDAFSSSRGIKRIYTNKDPLYLYGGGRLVASKVVPASSSDMLKAHRLTEFASLYPT